MSSINICSICKGDSSQCNKIGECAKNRISEHSNARRLEIESLEAEIKYHIKICCKKERKINRLTEANEKLKESLKLKTLNEVESSINKDCLDGCRVMLNRVSEEVIRLRKEVYSEFR